MIKINSIDELINQYEEVKLIDSTKIISSSFDYIAYDNNCEFIEDFENVRFDIFTKQYFNPCFIEGNNTVLILGSCQCDTREDIFSSKLVRVVKSVLEKYKKCEVYRYNIIEPRQRLENKNIYYKCYTPVKNIADFISQKIDDRIFFIGYINMKRIPNTPEELCGPNRTLRTTLGIETDEQMNLIANEIQVAIENMIYD